MHRCQKYLRSNKANLRGFDSCDRPRNLTQYRENRPVTQTTPDRTLLIWGGWQHEPPPYTLDHAAKPGLNALIRPLNSDPIVIEPFDVTLWHSGEPRTPNLLKISSDIESDFRNGFFAWRLPKLAGGGMLCSGAWKRGQDSHTAV